MASETLRASSPGALTAKGDRDIVSEVDLAIERRLRAHLHEKTPEIGFLGEEDGTAEWGDGGAYANERRLRLGPSRTLGEAIVSLGDFAVGASSQARNQLRVEIARQLADRALRVRMLGSAAIDLAWVAEAKLEAVSHSTLPASAPLIDEIVGLVRDALDRFPMGL
jgi:myo-inositol-1(or 4)-monophosphatase